MVVLLVTQIISLASAFILNKKFVFQTKGNVLREFGRFGIFYWLSFGANIALLPILVEFLNWPPVFSQGLLICITIVGGYFWHSLVTFAGVKPST
jgi:putative flippase GtrA